MYQSAAEYPEVSGQTGAAKAEAVQAIENMTLAAATLGLGSLWICDSFFAQQELSAWAGGELYAVLAVGYAAENPAARPRRQDVVEWRED